jgi:Transposase domain (DUF772)
MSPFPSITLIEGSISSISEPVVGPRSGPIDIGGAEDGRPSVDPGLMIRMLIIGHCYGLRSGGKLAQEVEPHLAYQWFCRLDLDDKVPHHSTFSENRLNRFRESNMARSTVRVARVSNWHSGLV